MVRPAKKQENMAHSQGVKKYAEIDTNCLWGKTSYGFTRQILYINCFKYAERDLGHRGQRTEGSQENNVSETELQIQCNPYQNHNSIFYRHGKAEIHIELQFIHNLEI